NVRQSRKRSRLAVKWGPLERGDLRDEKAVRRAFERWNPCGVMHFAAYAYVGESNVDPVKYYDNNVGGTANPLKACAAYECKKFIFSSPYATYSTPNGTCIREYVHVSELADAHVSALDWLAAGQASSAFNLGNGRGFFVADVVQTAQVVSELTIKSHLAPRRSGDPPVLISDSTKA